MIIVIISCSCCWSSSITFSSSNSNSFMVFSGVLRRVIPCSSPELRGWTCRHYQSYGLDCFSNFLCIQFLFFFKRFVPVPVAPNTIGISLTLMLHRFLSSLARSMCFLATTKFSRLGCCSVVVWNIYTVVFLPIFVFKLILFSLSSCCQYCFWLM